MLSRNASMGKFEVDLVVFRFLAFLQCSLLASSDEKYGLFYVFLPV